MGLRTAMGVMGVVLLVTGCGGVGDAFKQPDVKLDRVVLRGAGLTGGTLDLVVNVNNPNGFDLRGTKLAVGFDVEDSHVGDVEYTDAYEVRKHETTTLTLPLRFNWLGVGGGLRTALGYGDLPYKMRGQLTLEVPGGRRVVPFSLEGRAPLSKIGGALPIPGTR